MSSKTPGAPRGGPRAATGLAVGGASGEKSTCQKRRLGTRPDACRMHSEGADAESQLARAQRAPDDPPEGIEGQSVNTTCGFAFGGRSGVYLVDSVG